MDDQVETSHKYLIRLAYGGICILSLVALILSLFLLLLVLQSGPPGGVPIWQFSRPFLLAVVPWLFLDILTRDVWYRQRQRPKWWLWIVILIGCGALSIYSLSYFDMVTERPVTHRAPMADLFMFFVPVGIGALALAATIQIARRQPAML